MLGSFNIRKLSRAKGRERELDFMARFCAACDLVAIQEVQDDVDSLRYLKERTESRVAGRGEYALAISDITGEVPGESGMAERLAFLYRHRRLRRLELASDLTYSVLGTLSMNGIDVLCWLDTWLKECAESSRQPPDDLSPWLPWSMSEERRRELTAPG